MPNVEDLVVPTSAQGLLARSGASSISWECTVYSENGSTARETLEGVHPGAHGENQRQLPERHKSTNSRKSSSSPIGQPEKHQEAWTWRERARRVRGSRTRSVRAPQARKCLRVNGTTARRRDAGGIPARAHKPGSAQNPGSVFCS